MIEKLGMTDLQKALQDAIAERTGISTYDSAPVNTPTPFYFVQVVGKTDASTKTMARETFRVWVHAIAEAGDSSVGVYSLVQGVEEALTDSITLPEGFQALSVTEDAIQQIQQDPSGEKHAIVQFSVTVFYGYRIKT